MVLGKVTKTYDTNRVFEIRRSNCDGGAFSPPPPLAPDADAVVICARVIAGADPMTRVAVTSKTGSSLRFFVKNGERGNGTT